MPKNSANKPLTKTADYPNTYCPVRGTMLLPDNTSAFDYVWFSNQTGEESRRAVRSEA